MVVSAYLEQTRQRVEKSKQDLGRDNCTDEVVYESANDKESARMIVVRLGIGVVRTLAEVSFVVDVELLRRRNNFTLRVMTRARMWGQMVGTRSSDGDWAHDE
ncbi:hypothetical protein DY000_02063388 [Brassica cretica]|uniref:Uncharacterized protein n=1 Tax=Brassica cretica TaxID=69181 RepID=A0ABQ7B2Z0_BRACR|nr:hypothetical protein DY000_02063388 [Brassica cretica]